MTDELTEKEQKILKTANLFTFKVEQAFIDGILTKISEKHPLYPEAKTLEAANYPDYPPGEKAYKFLDAGKLTQSKSGECWIHFSRAAQSFWEANIHDSAAYMYIEAAERQKQERTGKEAPIHIVACYQRAIASAELLGNRQLATDTHIALLDYERSRCKPHKKIVLFLYRLISLYGESSLRVAVFGAFIIFICALLYYLFGINNGGDLAVRSMINCLYFSTVTFTTLGYGDFSPGTDFVRLVASIEALLGLFTTSLFLVTFVKKYS